MRQKKINATQLLVAVIGLVLAFTGITHGIREIMHGNTPTGGMLVADVGALTLVQNYLITGIIAVILGAAIIFWTLGFIRTKNGPLVFLLLFILLFFFGGGIAQVLLFIVAWALSTRIDKPAGWAGKLPVKSLAENWAFCFAASMSLFGVGVLIWLTNYVPGVDDVNMKNYITWSFLAGGLIFLVVTIIAGFAHDIERLRDEK